MRRKIHWALMSARLVLFVLTTGLASYFAEEQQWRGFVATVCVGLALYALVELSQTAQFGAWLRVQEEREFRFATRMARSGIVDIYRMADPEQNLERNRATAEIFRRDSTFSILGFTASSYVDPDLHRHWNELRKRLEDGRSSVKILLLNPFCGEKRFRNKLKGRRPSRNDPKLRLELLIRLRARYRERLEIRFSSRNICCSVFYSDKEMIYDPHHLGKLRDELQSFFALRISAAPDTDEDTHVPYYEILKAHYEYLWSKAVPLEQFWTESRDDIEKLHPRLWQDGALILASPPAPPG